MIFVDYLQLMTGGKRFESRRLEVDYISSSLKGLSKELDIPVVALCQLNRSVESRKGDRPRLSDLRESGSIEQDADIVIFTNHKETDHMGVISHESELIVEKNRNGATGIIPVNFVRKYTKFTEKDIDV